MPLIYPGGRHSPEDGRGAGAGRGASSLTLLMRSSSNWSALNHFQECKAELLPATADGATVPTTGRGAAAGEEVLLGDGLGPPQRASLPNALGRGAWENCRASREACGAEGGGGQSEVREDQKDQEGKRQQEGYA